MRKKLLILMLTITLVFSSSFVLFGCGDDPEFGRAWIFEGEFGDNVSSTDVVWLRWERFSGAHGYFVELNGAQIFRTTQLHLDLNSTVVSTALLNGRNWFVVRAHFRGRNFSPYSEVVEFYYEPPLTVPSGFSGDGRTVSWTASAGASGYYVDFIENPDDEETMTVHTSFVSSPSFRIPTSFLPGFTYGIKVRAVTAGVPSSASAFSAAFSYYLPRTPLPVPEISHSGTNRQITWRAVPNATGYRVLVNGTESETYVRGSLSFSLTHTLPTTHTVTVQALGDEWFSTSSSNIELTVTRLPQPVITIEIRSGVRYAEWYYDVRASRYSVFIYGVETVLPVNQNNFRLVCSNNQSLPAGTKVEIVARGGGLVLDSVPSLTAILT
jgi:hypothetical protein